MTGSGLPPAESPDAAVWEAAFARPVTSAPSAPPDWAPAPPVPPGPPGGPSSVLAPAPARPAAPARPPRGRGSSLAWALAGIGVLAVLVAATFIVRLADHSSGSVNTSSAAGSTITTAPAPTTTTTLSPQAVSAGRRYLAAVGPLNQAQSAFAAGTGALPADATVAQVAALAAPYDQALATFDQAVSTLDLPAGLDRDRRQLLADDAGVRQDLETLAQLTPDQLDQWADQYLHDLRVATRASADLRRALGLPGSPGQGPTI